MRTAVFDLDGTLADTSADLLAAANLALGEAGHGAPLGRDDVPVAFRGGREMLRTGLSRVSGSGADEAEVERLYPRLLEAYSEGICRETRLYPGAEDALALLEARGWLLAVCTNKPVGLAELLLKRLGVAGRFRAVLGAGSLAVCKPHPEHLLATIARAGGAAEAAILIGDSETDREAARNAGVPCILVGFGPEGAGVSRLEPDAVLPDYGDLADLLDQVQAGPRRAVKG